VLLFLLIMMSLPLQLPSAVLVAIVSVLSAVFILVAFRHRRIDTAIRRCDAWMRMKRSQVARRRIDWDNLPEAMPIAVDASHPFAADIDLFGASGLHRLLDISVSNEGSRKLAQWLTDPNPDMDTIRERQNCIRDLARQSHFREHLVVEFSLVSKEKLDGTSFTNWLSNDELPASLRVALPVSLLLSVGNIAMFVLYGLNLLPPYFLLGLAAYAIVAIAYMHVRNTFLDAAITLDDELGRLNVVFRFLEEYPVRAGQSLSTLLDPLRVEAERPSVLIRRTRRNVLAAGLSMNPVTMVLLNVAFPWDMFFASALDRKRRKLACVFPGWLDTLHRLEALQSLANHAHLHPEYIFPDIDTSGATLLTARALGHPLLPPASRIRNDFELGSNRDIVLITGSNMSGKSTFLRTVGIGIVMANAGGPVDASQMRIAALRLFTCIHISDSLRDAVSYFHAEVRRLRALLDMLKNEADRPVVFLIDEMFRGTNTRERHVGGGAFVSKLAELGASGLISTHDLELTKLADIVRGVRNMHFREHIVTGDMRFDYRLREGPCPTTNALVIMRLAGLPVDEPQPETSGMRNDE